MMGEFKIPNMSGVQLENTPVRATNPELAILASLGRMNESVEGEEANVNTTTCPHCGASWTPAEDQDGTETICPMCGGALVDPEQPGVADPQVDPEPEKGEETEEAKLESTLHEYVELVNAGSLTEAKQLLADNEATVICESVDGGRDVLLEKFVMKVDASGHKVKKKVRTKKVRLTPAQKQSLRKARKTANKGQAKKKRKKAMKARARMGLNESIRKAQICASVSSLLESHHIVLNRKLIERAINEAYAINEDEVLLPEEKAQNALETVLNNAGLTLTDCSTEIVDGVLVMHTTVQDSDAEVYLGDIADNVEETLDGYSVDYDEPEENEDDPKLVDIDFYFIADTVSESCGSRKNESEDCDDPEKLEEEDEDEAPEGSKKLNEGDEEDEEKDPPKNESEGDPEDEDGKKEEDEPKNECDDPDKKIEESYGVGRKFKAMFESIGGGTSNIRCKLNPAFIKPGQVILDADSATVFKALTESVECDGEYSLAIEVCNSTNSTLSKLASGAEVHLSGKGNYFLMKNNPTA